VLLLDPIKMKDAEGIGNVCKRLGSRIYVPTCDICNGWETDYDRYNDHTIKNARAFFCKLIPFARERLHGGGSDFELYFDELGRLGIHKADTSVT
jgi:hypothetical protein